VGSDLRERLGELANLVFEEDGLATLKTETDESELLEEHLLAIDGLDELAWGKIASCNLGGIRCLVTEPFCFMCRNTDGSSNLLFLFMLNTEESCSVFLVTS
jgi:hypothetical protein